MCGIAGWFGTPDLRESREESMAGMLHRIRHRGPDGSSTAFLQGAALGHVRLAVIDPSMGGQPFWSQDRDQVIVFNGEIYNFRELREHPLVRGVHWRTNSDTELLLELVRAEGPRALSLLRGMFSFAFWDATTQTGLLARDPTGIKPLFLRSDNGCLWFASEAKAFPGTRGWSPSLDESQLHILLNLRYPGGGSGLMKGVQQLSPGHCIEWRLGRERQLSFGPGQEMEAVSPEGIRPALIDSVQAHLVADVPVASYLSGGVDSAIVTRYAISGSGHAIRTYTIDAGDDPNEAGNAARSARWLGVPNTRGRLAPLDARSLSWLLWHLEVPKVNALQSGAVAQLASRDVKVCLSGLGGDELFVGYRAHRHLAMASAAANALGPLGAFVSRMMTSVIQQGVFDERSRAAAMLSCRGDASRSYGILRNVWDGLLDHRLMYGPRMLDQTLPDMHEWIRAKWPAGRLPPALAMAEFEWRNKLVDDLLWQEDRTSMASGLEVRVPFVDERLRQQMRSVTRMAARHPGTKRLLRNAVQPDLPREILDRPKSGFQVDIAGEFDRLFAPVIHDWLAPEAVRRHGLFNPTFVSQMLKLDRTTGHRWHFFMLLLMAQTHHWLDLFENGSVGAPDSACLVENVA